MTAIAALVAEALAFAEANTDGNYAPSRFCVIRTDLDYVRDPEWGGAVPESFAKPGGSRVAYGRADFTLAALAHLAERLAEAEGRAERAEDLQRRTEQMWRAASDSADEWRNRCESSSKRGRDMMAALDRAEAAETALGRIVRDHWIEVAKKEVRSMEFDLERLYMMPAKPYGRIDRSARAQQARLQKIESDKRDRKELPRLIAQTKAAIESAGKEAPRG